MHKGKFIAFEGIDGSGKSTHLRLLKQSLEEKGHKVYSTFEPTDNYIGCLIRSIIKGTEKADNRTIAALFAADRLHHLLNENDGILKKINEGYIVLTDRFYFSSYAYHSVHMDMDWVIQLNKKSVELLRPDINVFIDVSPEVAMQRIQKSREQVDLYESLGMLKSVRENYLIAFEKMKNEETFISVNGEKNIEEVTADIWEGVYSLL